MKLTRVNRCKGAEDYWGRKETKCMHEHGRGTLDS